MNKLNFLRPDIENLNTYLYTGVFLILEMLFGQSQHYLMFFIFLAGVVGFARYSLKAHDLKQIYTGFILGLCIMCISIIYL